MEDTGHLLWQYDRLLFLDSRFSCIYMSFISADPFETRSGNDCEKRIIIYLSGCAGNRNVCMADFLYE